MLVARNSEGELLKIPIPLHYLYIFIAGALIGMLTITGMLGSYERTLKSRYSQHEQIARENQLQSESLSSLSDEVSDLYGLKPNPVVQQDDPSWTPVQSQIRMFKELSKREHASVLVYSFLGQQYRLLATDGITAVEIQLLSSGNIDSKVSHYLYEITDRPRGRPSNAYIRDGQDLYETLVAPAEQVLTRAKIIIVTDGLLNRLPFETLIRPQSAKGPHVFLLEDFDITYLRATSALWDEHRANKLADFRSWLFWGEDRTPSNLARSKVTVFADPSLPQSDWPRLPNSLQEARVISAHFPRDRVTIYAGTAATESAVESLSFEPKRPQILHFATHSVLRKDSTEPALLLSAAQNSDGFLKASDISRMSLRDVNLVVLSACSTGLIPNRKASDTLGLGAAFHRAGAKTVIESLWNVDDTTALYLMNPFYTYIEHGESASRALRNAKLQMLHTQGTSHPYYWAPFVNVGAF